MAPHYVDFRSVVSLCRRGSILLRLTKILCASVVNPSLLVPFVFLMASLLQIAEMLQNYESNE